MDATPPPELADHEERITRLENAMMNLSCELHALRTHMDCRFTEIEAKIQMLRIELQAEFEAKLRDAMDKLNARMDAQHHLQIALQVAIFLALIALFAQR